MTRIQLSGAVNIEAIQDLRRGLKGGPGAVAELFHRAEIANLSPAHDLSEVEVARVSPGIARLFDVSFSAGADEAACLALLEASPLVALVDGRPAAGVDVEVELATGVAPSTEISPTGPIAKPLEADAYPGGLAATPGRGTWPAAPAPSGPSRAAIRPVAGPWPTLEAPADVSAATAVQPAEQVFAYAGFWLRFGAVAIDAVIFWSAWFVVVLVASPGGSGLAGLAVLAFPVLGWLYCAAFESSAWQGTPGKKAVGAVVVDVRGERLSFGRASARYAARYLTWLVPLGVGWMMAGFTEKKQALHDIIAGTLVIRRTP
jgi:uncharacterized RDD family membrane protein YckC